MTTATGTYLGDLRIACRHERSGTVIMAEAPEENGGRGQSFSPSDLVCMGLGACAMNLIGRYARDRHIDVQGLTVSVTKHMAAQGKRIERVELLFTMPARSYTEEQKAAMEHAAHTCPVHQSLHPDMKKDVRFLWQD